MLSILRDFKNRGGGWFFSSSIFDKLTRVTLTFSLIAFLSKLDYGYWTLAFTLVSTLIPIKSLGIEAGILQYSSGLKKEDIDILFKNMFLKGLLFSLLFTLLSITYIFCFSEWHSKAHIIVYILSFWLPCFFLFEFLLNYYRVTKDHKKYAIIQTFYNVIFLVSVLIGFVFFSLNGVAIAFVLAPIITFLRFIPDFLNAKKIDWSIYNFRSRDIIFYGFKTSFTNYASVLLFYSDIFLIQYLTHNEVYISEYRTATIIPFNLSFFAVLYLNNDFVFLVENKLNKKKIREYLKNYTLLFTAFVAFVFIALFPFAEFWWKDVLFNGAYISSVVYFKVLLFGTIAMILFRIPTGNILSAVGKVHLNTIIGYATVCINLVLSFILFKSYGVLGIAYSTVTVLFVSGIVMYVFVLKYLNKK